jgi:DNA-binding NarL/FixJ family response regulator
MEAIRIVLAIDTPATRAAVAEFVEVCPGLEIAAQVSTGAEAFAEAVLARPELVLVEAPPTTNMMTATSCIRIFTRLTKQYCPQTKVVLLAAETNNCLAASVVATGVDGIVSRDDLPVQLLLLIEEFFLGRPGESVKGGAAA